MVYLKRLGYFLTLRSYFIEFGQLLTKLQPMKFGAIEIFLIYRDHKSHVKSIGIKE